MQLLVLQRGAEPENPSTLRRIFSRLIVGWLHLEACSFTVLQREKPPSGQDHREFDC